MTAAMVSFLYVDALCVNCGNFQMRALFIVFALLTTAYCLCKVGGKDRSDNEKWVEGSFLKQCLKVGNYGGWRTTILGCMVDSKQIAIGTNVTIGKTTYVCEDVGNGNVRMRYFWHW
ncbi:unnamed protein product [Cylicocyclus nassatus]|uniref:Abnormal cell migration protein 18-like fibronectin type I domain-containing protein n=1 Tax=Cylicocyclus nassatus TaxID=53992 RepID=A0AA36MCX9_CYLNA|nr:unnamed protein product [Cylicocyclus nassatus]